MSGKATDLGRQAQRKRSKREWAIRWSLVVAFLVVNVGLYVAEGRHLISSHAWTWWFVGVMAVNLAVVVGINWYFNNKRKQQQTTTAPH